MYDGSVEAGDDLYYRPGAVVLHGFDAIEVGVLCNPVVSTTDCASDMGAIWKGGGGGIEKGVSEAEKVVRYSCGFLGSGQQSSIAFPGGHNASRAHTIQEGRVLTSIEVFAGNISGKAACTATEIRMGDSAARVEDVCVCTTTSSGIEAISETKDTGFYRFWPVREASDSPGCKYLCRDASGVHFNICNYSCNKEWNTFVKEGVRVRAQEKRTFFDPGDFGLLPEDIESVG